jgi:hypothetical protein
VAGKFAISRNAGKLINVICPALDGFCYKNRQAGVFGILKRSVWDFMIKAIVRNHQNRLNQTHGKASGSGAK